MKNEVLIAQRATLDHYLQGQDGTWAMDTVRHNLVDLVGVGDVQLAALTHLTEVHTLVESTAKPCLPGRGVLLVSALQVLALVYGPGLGMSKGICAGISWGGGLVLQKRMRAHFSLSH